LFVRPGKECSSFAQEVATVIAPWFHQRYELLVALVRKSMENGLRLLQCGEDSGIIIELERRLV